jgi:hypothetical protein
MRARTTLAIVCALLLGGAMAAQAQGRITVTQMYITSCEEMGSCEFRLTCESGGKEVEMIAAAIATNPDTIPINKSVEAAKYPATVSCTLFEDDGWFGESWDEAAKGSVSLTGGGDYELKLSNPEQASVVLTLVADSIESTLTAPSAAVPAGGKVIKAAPRQFLAIFRKESEAHGHAVILGLEWPAFQKKIQELAEQGVHPTDLETWLDGGKRMWGGIFRSGADASKVIPGLEWEAFLEQYTKLSDAENVDEQMQLIDMEIYPEKGKNLFAGVFRNGTEIHSLWIGQDRGDFIRKWQQLVNQQLRLMDLEIYRAVGGSRNLYAGVFMEAPGSYGIWNATDWKQFEQKRIASGSGLWDVETYMEDGKRLYDGVILGGGTSEELPGMLDGPALVAKWRDMLGKGYRMIHLEIVE